MHTHSNLLGDRLEGGGVKTQAALTLFVARIGLYSLVCTKHSSLCALVDVFFEDVTEAAVGYCSLT